MPENSSANSVVFCSNVSKIVFDWTPFQDGVCRFKKQDVGATDTGFVDIPHGDENALKEAVATIGPISVAIDAGHQSFMLYKSGIYY